MDSQYLAQVICKAVIVVYDHDRTLAIPIMLNRCADYYLPLLCCGVLRHSSAQALRPSPAYIYGIVVTCESQRRDVLLNTKKSAELCLPRCLFNPLEDAVSR